MIVDSRDRVFHSATIVLFTLVLELLLEQFFDTEIESETTSDVKSPRFHGKRGEDYVLWRHRLRATCRINGV